MQKELYFVIAGITICVIIISVSVFSIVKKSDQKTETNKTKTSSSQKTDENLYYINDESLGLTFTMDKTFNRIDQKELSQTNPYVVYGFKPKDVSDVSCYVSQTKRTSSGSVSAEYLKDGTFSEIKKNTPEIKLDNWKKITLGNIDGAFLDMTYKEADKEIKQIEIVGTTEAKTTFAFCTIPKSLYEFYEAKINNFINSFSIK